MNLYSTEAVAEVSRTRRISADKVAGNGIAASAVQRNPITGEAIDDEAANGGSAADDNYQPRRPSHPHARAVQFDEQHSVIANRECVRGCAGLRVAVNDDGVGDGGE